jgi:DnaK suppressor protein
MDPDRARELLAAERERIERQLGALQPENPPEGSGRREPGERGSEALFQGELDEGRRGELIAQLAAVERAEERLVAGTYGLSIESGDPIPDARLEALPTAERTVDEERRRR